MHAHSALLCFWITLFTIVSLATSSPVPEPEPAPIDPKLASVISSNLNQGCQHGCPAAASAQQLDKNAALGSVVSPLSIFGGLIFASGVLTAI